MLLDVEVKRRISGRMFHTSECMRSKICTNQSVMMGIHCQERRGCVRDVSEVFPCADLC